MSAASVETIFISLSLSLAPSVLNNIYISDQYFSFFLLPSTCINGLRAGAGRRQRDINNNHLYEWAKTEGAHTKFHPTLGHHLAR